MMSNMVEAGWLQQFDYDKLMMLTEAAQVHFRARGSCLLRALHCACQWSSPRLLFWGARHQLLQT